MSFRERLSSETIIPHISEVSFFRDCAGLYRVETYTEPGSTTKPSEDTVLVRPPRIAIFDGQTSLNGNKIHKGRTGGAIASAIARNTLAKLDNLLRTQVIQANQAIHDHMVEAGTDMSDPLSRWSTSCAAIDIFQDDLDCVTIGDSVIVVKLKNGKTGLVTPYIEHDKPTLEAMMEIINEHKARGEIITPQNLLLCPEVDSLIKQVRRNSNINHGFLNGDQRAERYVYECRIKRGDVATLLIFTDGYFLPRENPIIPPNWTEIMEIYEREGMLGLRKHIRDIEEEDQYCMNKPRFKTHDDGAISSVQFYTKNDTRLETNVDIAR